MALVDLVPIKPEVLALREIPSCDPGLAKELGLRPDQRSLGLVTCTCDDALYCALDEGTKAATVEVVYAKSFYAGAAHASGPLSGEILGIYAAHEPSEIKAALARCQDYLRDEAWFYAADERQEIAFYPHVRTALGSYLARESGLQRGVPMAYLIAPPIESLVGLDAALKAAPVRLVKWFGPPTETNFGGGFLAGDLPAVEAAARAFAAAVVDVARHPRAPGRDARGAGEELEARPPGPSPAGRYRVLATGQRLREKPEHLTHLVDDESLVPKTHPRLILRGRLDTLQGLLLQAQTLAAADNAPGLVGDLEEVLDLTRRLVGSEVTGRPLGEVRLLRMSPAELREASHQTWERYGVPFMLPEARHGPVVAAVYLARAYAREAEVAVYHAFAAGERDDLKLALNRLSSALYVMTCMYVGGRYHGGRRPAGPVQGWRPPGEPVPG